MLAAHSAPTVFNPHVHGGRGLFAMMIMAYHVLDSEQPSYPFAQVSPWRDITVVLPFGVELFFAISGFVILGALSRAPSLATFLRDRVARIGPVLWTTVLFMAIVGVGLGRRSFDSRSPGELLWGLVASLLALPGMLPIWGFHDAAWSISYELAFYLLCGSAVWLAGRWGAPRAALVWVPAAMLLANFYPRGLPFLVGVLVALGHGERFRPFARMPGLLLAGFLACWSIVAGIGPDRQWMHATTLVQWAGDARLPVGLFALGLLLLAFQGIVDGAGWLGRLLVTRPMLFLGTISYSIYMWHGPVMGAVRHAVIPRLTEDPGGAAARILFPLLCLAIVIPVATVSWRLLEVTGSAVLRRWLGARRGVTAVAVPG